MSIQTILKTDKYRLDVFSGQVVDYTERTETEITGGHYSRIGSVTHTYNQVFIVDEQGVEHSFSTHNWNIPMRAGHKLNVVALFSQNAGSGDVIAVKNVNLDQYFLQGLEKAVKNIYKPLLRWGIIIQFISPFALTWGLFAFSDSGILTTLFMLLIGVIWFGSIASIVMYHIKWRSECTNIRKVLQNSL